MAKRTCTFCGGGNLTKEHVLPRWLSKVVSFDNSTGELRGDAEYNEVARRSIPISPGERQVRNVCAGCNQGWMSDLETATEPVLTPLILGEERTLTAEEVDVLALWAAKTAVTTQFVMRDSGEIPRRQAAQIFERQRPAAEMQVFIAQMAEPWGVACIPDRVHFGARRVITLGSASRVERLRVVLYATTITLERAVIQVIGTSDRMLYEPPRFAEEFEGIRRIWPRPRPLTLPRERLLTDRELALMTYGRLHEMREGLVELSRVAEQRGQP